ncbi:MAG TPA: hypothetical protein VEK12_18255 [Alphaproteobacteria bacterium]|nr:hypothetical protein [Alphaproteobacteria bacterium]
MPQPIDHMRGRWKDHRRALLSALLLAGLFFVLARPPEFAAFIFKGGARVLAYNAALALLVPAFLLAFLALGRLWHRMTRSPPEPALSGAEELLLTAIAGSALMSLAGFALGAASLLRPALVAALFIAACYWLLLRGGSALATACSSFSRWLSAAELKAEVRADQEPRLLAIALRALVAVLLLLMALVRAVYFDADSTDVVQFYIPYLEEIRHQHGIWLAPDRPIYLDFLTGRGNGVYLVGAALANGLVGHAISSAFLFLLALLVRALVVKALTGSSDRPLGRGLAVLFPDLAVLLLATVLLDVSFGKYYLQTAVWFVGLLYGVLHYAAAGREGRSSLVRLLSPLLLALPLSLPQYQAFAAGILAIAAAALALRGERAGRRGLLLLFAMGISACLASLALNWAYLGVPELAPYWLFEPLIIPRIFGRYTSTAVQLYTNYIQGYTSSFLNIQPSAEAGAWLAVVTSAAVGWLTAAGEVLLVALGLAALRAAARAPRLEAFLASALTGAALAALALAALRWLAPPFGANGASYLGLAFYALLLALVVAAVLGLLASPSARQATFGRDFRTGAGVFAFGLAAYLVLAALFVAFVRSGSLARLMQPSEALLPALGLVLAGLFARWLERRAAARGVLPLRHLALAPALLEAATALSLLVAGSALALGAKEYPPLAVARYLAGFNGREASIAAPRAPFDKCLEIARAVPGGASVLHLNGYTSMSYCMFSPLLPRNKLVHQYESAFARRFRDAVFSAPERAQEVYRSLGINFFLVEKHNIDFWAPGLSPLMRAQNLPRYFDLYADTPSFYILTWRKSGNEALPESTVAAVERWRRIGLQREGFMIGDVLLGHWRALLWMGMERPPYAWDSVIDFAEGGASGLYLEHGWSSPTASGTWTLSPEAELALELERVPAEGARLTVTAQAFTPPEQPVLETTVLANEAPLGHWLFVAGEPERPRSLLIPAALMRREAPLHLAFRFVEPKSPRELGVSSDPRPLGLFVRTVQLGDARAPAAAAYLLGTMLDFTRNGTAGPYLGDGWLTPDAIGTWSVGPSAELVLALAAPPAGDGVLKITASALTGPSRLEVAATVRVNGTAVGTLRFKQGEAIAERTLDVPHALLVGPGPLRITLELSDTRPPKGLGIAPDPRPLGLSLRGLSLAAK